MKTLHRIFGAAMVSLLFTASGYGATNYWTPTLFATYNITNSTYWTLGSPNGSDTLYVTNGPSDTSVWTNNSAIVSSDVWLDSGPAGGGGFRRINLNLGSQGWTVTNSFDVGHSSAVAKQGLTVTTGTLAVTNGSGTATMRINALTGTGSVTIIGGTVIADHLYATNSFGGSGYGLGQLDVGTLVTKGASTLTGGSGANFYIGTWGSSRAEWQILGGTNLLNGSYTTLSVSYGGIYGAGSGVNTGVVTVSGPGAVLQAGNSGTLQVQLGANAVSLGQLIVSNGGVANIGQLSVGNASSNSLALVTGSNSVLNMNGQLYLGNGSGAGNTVRVEQGGRLVGANAAAFLGANGGQNARIVVDGPGSIMTNVSDIFVGGPNALGGNGMGFIVITNGGVLQANSSVYVGGRAGSYGEVRISGPGSLLQVGYNGLNVGSNSASTSWDNSPGLIVINDGGTLEPGAKMIAGLLGAITNIGGFFQFTAAAPVVSNQVPGTIVLTNGALSFRAINNAPLAIGGQLTNITYQGSIGFQLSSATNVAGLASYTFDSGSISTNYQRLILTGNNPFWRSAALTIGSGGELIATNSTGASIGAVLTNSGTVRVVNSILTYLSNVVQNGGSFITTGGTNQFNRGLTLAGNSTLTFTNSASRVAGVISNNAGSTIQALNTTVTFQDGVTIGGLYYSDPSTNIFNTNVTVTASGALYGSNGDLFVFNRDLAMQSTNRSQYDLSAAAVLFTNGSGATGHVFDLTGSGALDKGSNWISVADLATNFSIGTLSLADGNTLSVTGAAANALYVGTLDLQGLTDTNQLASRLWLGVNLYYDQAAAGNAYLGAKVYDLPGAGLLIPIPEPTTLALGILVLAGLALKRHRPE